MPIPEPLSTKQELLLDQPNPPLELGNRMTSAEASWKGLDT